MFLLRLRRLELGDLGPLHPPVGQFLYLDAQAVGLHHRAAAVGRDHVQPGKDQAAQSLGLLLFREFHVQGLGQLLQLGGARHPPQILPQGHDLLVLLGVELVVDVAHQLLQQVLHGDDAAGAAVFVYVDNYRYQALRTLTRSRFDVIQNLTREKQRFANYLFLKCSGIAQAKDIQNTSATTIALMEHFESVDDLANADLNELNAFISKAGRGKFADPNATAKAVQAAARGSYRLPKTVNDTVNQAMAVSITSMRALKEQVKTLDNAIEQQFEIIPNTLTSIPGIGKVYSAGIIAEIGDVHRFDSQASVAKFAGLVWTQHQSSEFEAETTHLIKSGNRYLRYYLLEAANSVRRCDSEFQRYYDLKFHEVNRFQHKRALALTARKLVRLVFRLLKDNRLYIPLEG